jgi:hypothetical protein
VTTKSNPFERWLVRLGSGIGTIWLIYSMAKEIIKHPQNVPDSTGFLHLNVVLILGVFTAIAFGVFWQALEKIFGWKYGAGGHGRLPRGWSAVALSISMTLPLVIIPPLYQYWTRLKLLDLPSHLKGSISVMLLGIVANLLLYGVGPSFMGLRHHILPVEKRRPAFALGIFMELVYALVYFTLIVLPYRLIVEWPNPSLLGTVINRTILPGLSFFCGMTLFISAQPEALRDRPWIMVRGIVGAMLLMGCFCVGMFG